MTVTVTKMPGGVVELFNPDTGKITYKAKADTAFLNLDSFGGVLKFTKKGAKATILGNTIETDSCEIIKKDSPNYISALKLCLSMEKEFLEKKSESIAIQISEIQSRLEQLK